VSAYGANVLLDLVEALQRLPAAVVDETSKRFVQIAEEEAGRAGMRSISPGKYGPYPLTAKLKSVRASDVGAEMTFVGYPVAFWVWAEEGTRAHMIRPRSRFSESEKGNYRAAMSGGLGHPITASVRHPGQRGRAAWTHTVDRVDNEFGNIVDDAAGMVDLWGV
jgi:hypothetical protein